MRIISKKKIRDFSKRYAQAELPLAEWYYKMKEVRAKSFNELKKIFNSADYINGYTIFDISGNKYRLVAALHYETQICYIREIWTHTEYSKKSSQSKIRGKQL